jgi:murein DD-endopeptidase MepM/ murein hydrolase activator NlpD
MIVSRKGGQHNVGHYLGWIVALSVGLGLITEMIKATPRVVAEEQAASAIEATPANPWQQGASFPVEQFTAYTSPFGYRQHPMGGYRFHYGLDLAAPMGSYIRSWWDGKVLRVGSDSACGTYVLIESGDWTHVYCHMQGYIVVEKEGGRVMVDRAGGLEIRQGQSVKAGQQIGRVGMTGATTGPHLHWGLKYQGVWVDPALVIKAMYQEQQP